MKLNRAAHWNIAHKAFRSCLLYTTLKTFDNTASDFNSTTLKTSIIQRLNLLFYILQYPRLFNPTSHSIATYNQTERNTWVIKG